MYIFNLPQNAENLFFHIKNGSYRYEHTHNGFWEIMFVSAGEYVHKINGSQIKLKKNMLSLIRPNDVHSLLAVGEKSAAHHNLGVNAEFFKTFLDSLSPDLYQSLLVSEPPVFRLSEEDANSIVKASELIFTSEKSTKNKALSMYLINIVRFILLSKIQTKQQNVEYGKITSTLISMITFPENLSLNLNELIQKTGYSYPHANRVFIQETGTSLFHYFRDQKINYAKKLLSSTDYTLEIIAEKTGYSSSYALSATFKKLVGVSPAAYVKNHKKHYGINDVE